MNGEFERKSNRLSDFDYSESGWYFVTMCTRSKQEYFGEIKNEKMILNELGVIIERQWQWLAMQYDYVRLDEFCVMPDHFHGIIYFDPDHAPSIQFRRDNPRVVPTKTESTIYHRRFNLLSKTICAFKTTSSKMIHQSGQEFFAWQRSFHDHVIRNEPELNRIREYIWANPLMWQLDRTDDAFFESIRCMNL